MVGSGSWLCENFGGRQPTHGAFRRFGCSSESRPGVRFCVSRQLSATERNRYRDSPLRGVLADSVATEVIIFSGEAVPSITTVPPAKSSSTVEYELRCFGRSRRSPAPTLSEIMRNAVSEATRVPERAHHRSVHVSHSCFAGLQRRSPSGSQLLGEMHVLPFCSSHWSDT